MNRTAARAMQSMGEEYERLKGYYPEPKEIYFSDLLSQTYMKGYYFPFSMEANYNETMYVANKPNTICHEFAHLKGFIQEDEANLIGYLACVSSEDPMFRYSGYLGVIDYVEREFKKSIGNSKKNTKSIRRFRSLSTGQCFFDKRSVAGGGTEGGGKHADCPAGIEGSHGGVLKAKRRKGGDGLLQRRREAPSGLLRRDFVRGHADDGGRGSPRAVMEKHSAQKSA